jgi:hypothetical protein
MTRHARRGSLFRPCLPAALALCLLPGAASAETLLLRNECNGPVVVQAFGVWRGRVFRDRPYLLQPGDVSPAIMVPGDKVVTVYDAKVPNRILFQGAVPAGRVDLFFGVIPDLLPGRVRLDVRRAFPPRR